MIRLMKITAYRHSRPAAKRFRDTSRRPATSPRSTF